VTGVLLLLLLKYFIFEVTWSWASSPDDIRIKHVYNCGYERQTGRPRRENRDSEIDGSKY
jgi:hypothetical protein